MCELKKTHFCWQPNTTAQDEPYLTLFAFLNNDISIKNADILLHCAVVLKSDKRKSQFRKKRYELPNSPTTSGTIFIFCFFALRMALKKQFYRLKYNWRFSLILYCMIAFYLSIFISNYQFWVD